jgi:formylglycine-generating enzyme required for sulfatase activity
MRIVLSLCAAMVLLGNEGRAQRRPDEGVTPHRPNILVHVYKSAQFLPTDVSRLVEFLRRKGAEVEELPLGAVVTDKVLFGRDLVVKVGIPVLGAPDVSVKVLGTEIRGGDDEAYRQYVAGGGKLLLGQSTPLESLGISMRGMARGNQRLERFVPHPITRNVRAVDYDGFGVVPVAGNVTLLGFLSRGSYHDRDNDALKDDEDPEAPAGLGLVEFGKGVVVFMGSLRPLREVSQPLVENIYDFLIPSTEPAALPTRPEASTSALPAEASRDARPKGRDIAPATSRSASGFTKPRVRSDPRDPELQWALVPAGTFEMGCVPGDTECHADETRHTVTLTRAFEMMTTEATVGMWQRALRPELGGRFGAGSDGKRVFLGNQFQPAWNSGARQPLVHISWSVAYGVCSALGGRLPTEAEWEYAARGGLDGARYPWGNASPVHTAGAPSGAEFSEYERGRGNDLRRRIAGTGHPGPVAKFAPNGFGLFDVSGNVWEWVSDQYALHTAQAERDPLGPRGSPGSPGVWVPLRGVLRGGSWDIDPWDLRMSARDYYPLDFADSLVGVRCARSL